MDEQPPIPVPETPDTFTADADKMAALAAEQRALVDYEPKSQNPKTFGTLIPRNLAFEVQKGLNLVIREQGNVDNYVLRELKYSTVKELWSAFSAEQIDSLALYLQQFQQEMGLIVGDEPGLGKGRQVAAVMKHAHLNGYIPVFCTRTAELFTDIYRDLEDIHYTGVRPFLLNTDRKANVQNQDGAVVFTPLDPVSQKDVLVNRREVATDSPEAIAYYRAKKEPLPNPEETPTVILEEVIDYLPPGYNCIWLSYSQINQADWYKREWVEALARKGVEGSTRNPRLVFILDESHMAGGTDSSVGKWFREILPSAKSAFFASATFAKDPSSMPLYATKTAIAEANMRDEQLVGAMQSGGLALQEIITSNLAITGQLIRRQRKREGPPPEYIVLDQEPLRSENLAKVELISGLVREVIAFEERYVYPAQQLVHKKTKKKSENLKKKPRNLGVVSPPYFSRLFNLVDQMLFGLLADPVAELAIDLLNQDKKVTIAFKSTLGTFLKDEGFSAGDAIPIEEMDFARSMVKTVDNLLNYVHVDIRGHKTTRRLTEKEMGREGMAKFEQLLEKIRGTVTGLPISPIDRVREAIEKAKKAKRLGGHTGPNFTVGEVTGRSMRLRTEEGDFVVESFRKDTVNRVRTFNSGGLDVLLLNQSGSTGLSLHSSERFIDQRQRVMIIQQFDVDVATQVQMWGRIDRSGQVVPPEYYYVVADIPAMKRMLNMLKAKLKKMDANTTGSQRTNDGNLESDDFFNKYGDAVAWQWVLDNQELVEAMGWPTYHRNREDDGLTWVRNSSKVGAISQLTGRITLLPVDQQSPVYDDLLSRYLALVEYAKQQGVYDLEVEFLPLDGEVRERFLYLQGPGGKSPFGKDTLREETVITNLKKPLRLLEIDRQISELLGDQTAKDAQSALTKRLKAEYPAIIESREQDRLKALIPLEESLAALPDPKEVDDPSERASVEFEANSLRHRIHQVKEAVANYVTELEATRDLIIRGVEAFLAGDLVYVPFLGSTDISPGIFIGVIQNTTARNPWTRGSLSFRFAVADHRRIVEYNLAGEQYAQLMAILGVTKTSKPEDLVEIRRNWRELSQGASKGREVRHILTQNVLLVHNQIGSKNKLIKYNIQAGAIKNGVLLHPDYGSSSEELKALLPISHAYPIIRELKAKVLFTDHKVEIKFNVEKEGHFRVRIKSKRARQVVTDELLRSHLMRRADESPDKLPEFFKQSGSMTGLVSASKLEVFLKRLDHHQFFYLGEATLPGEDEEERPTGEAGVTYAYGLQRPFGEASNPGMGLIDFIAPDDEQADPNYPMGVVVYDHPLSPKQRFQYSLIPVFKDSRQPYQQWKAAIEGTAIERDYQERVRSSRDLNLDEAYYKLGRFIFNHLHEEGNPEFVLGKFSEEQIGTVAYQDMIGDLSPLDELLAMLKTELNQAS